MIEYPKLPKFSMIEYPKLPKFSKNKTFSDFMVKCDMSMTQERIYDNMAAVVDTGIEYDYNSMIRKRVNR